MGHGARAPDTDQRHAGPSSADGGKDNVLMPMGWDAFGLPADNEAKEQGSACKPRPATRSATKAQMQAMGWPIDW